MIRIDGNQVLNASFVLPRYGVWTVRGEISEPVIMTGQVSIVDDLAGRTLVCTIRESRIDAGRGQFEAVGGAGGWAKTLPREGYHNDAGVKTAIVVGDAARLAGETLSAAPGGLLPAHFARRAGAASGVLHALFPKAWYVNDAGQTVLATPTAFAYDVASSVVTPDSYADCVSIAADSLAKFAPGLTVGGLVYGDVEITVTSDKITAIAYAKTDSTSIVSRIADAVLNRLKYTGVFEYRVASVDSDYRCNVQPVLQSSSMPELARVPFRGVSGVRFKPQPGASVLLTFVDGNPSRPVIIAGDDNATDGWAAESDSTVDISAGGTLDAAAKATPTDDNFAQLDAAIQAALAAITPAGGGSAVVSAYEGAMSVPLASVAASDVRLS